MYAHEQHEGCLQTIIDHCGPILIMKQKQFTHSCSLLNQAHDLCIHLLMVLDTYLTFVEHAFGAIAARVPVGL